VGEGGAPLLAVPNVSEGRDAAALDAIASAFAGGGRARVLDVHSDPDHHRSVLTLAGEQGALADALLAGAREVLARVDVGDHEGVHPRVGALDVIPVVHLDALRRGPACAEALVAAELLGGAGVPVFLYGALGGGRTRAELRRGGPAELKRRMEAGELVPDFGPLRPHPTAGAALVAARPPLVAFNLELGPAATLADARGIAARIRERGEEGLPGVRAIGLRLERARRVQVSTNVENYERVPLSVLVAAVRRHAEVTATELVGLAPAAAFEGFPDDVVVRNRRTVEDALR
jgi:glutamate formiminotransferase/glutamate formiminotransferase/formiminotetrahydrofolate cyclodeaminase